MYTRPENTNNNVSQYSNSAWVHLKDGHPVQLEIKDAPGITTEVYAGFTIRIVDYGPENPALTLVQISAAEVPGFVPGCVSRWDDLPEAYFFYQESISNELYKLVEAEMEPSSKLAKRALSLARKHRRDTPEQSATMEGWATSAYTPEQVELMNDWVVNHGYTAVESEARLRKWLRWKPWDGPREFGSETVFEWRVSHPGCYRLRGGEWEAYLECEQRNISGEFLPPSEIAIPGKDYPQFAVHADEGRVRVYDLEEVPNEFCAPMGSIVTVIESLLDNGSKPTLPENLAFWPIEHDLVVKISSDGG